jgi:hypothetical protein
MEERCTIMTVVPTGGIDPRLPLGWGPGAVWMGWLADGLPAAGYVAMPVAFALAEFVGVVAALLGDEVVGLCVLGVFWAAVLEGGLAAEVELGDPPHPVSSTSVPSPAAIAHQLLRIRIFLLWPLGIFRALGVRRLRRP